MFAQNTPVPHQGKRCPSLESSPGELISNTQPRRATQVRRKERNQPQRPTEAPAARHQPQVNRTRLPGTWGRQDRRVPGGLTAPGPAGGRGPPPRPGSWQPPGRAEAAPRLPAAAGSHTGPPAPPRADGRGRHRQRAAAGFSLPAAPHRLARQEGTDPSVREPPGLGRRRLFGGLPRQRAAAGAHAVPPLRSPPARPRRSPRPAASGRAARCGRHRPAEPTCAAGPRRGWGSRCGGGERGSAAGQRPPPTFPRFPAAQQPPPPPRNSFLGPSAAARGRRAERGAPSPAARPAPHRQWGRHSPGRRRSAPPARRARAWAA